ncbi:hypothetical protein EB118_15605 [bacterium]|nr:hypothetical protein [bacterium]NDC95502.1 hypothetical protein [bacterium]NDD85236.1 hypothetical protein [bacterium]NDG31480.1 hypothetical protein [bacterium]
MKLADRTVDTHNRGTVHTNQFSISQTSKMFRILSDSLYSDKIQAVIRELSTNAYDSHVASGNKNPFKITLPTAANPNFVVRDYGTGLSREDMESLYTTYGASNKNHSNDFVGCLGLGSKSPFAYTKSFSASSYYQGMKYTYIAALDESGVPTLNLFNSCDTDEPNGLEIGFAVKQHDFQEFSNKAKRIYHYFRMKPIIEGGIGGNLQDHKYSNTNIVISGEGWRVCRLNNDNNYFPSSYHRIDSGVIAVMGNIAYPVETAQIIGEEKQESPDHIQRWNRAFQKADIDSWKNFVHEIINSGLYLELDFGIGEVEVDASREGLQYTKDVIKTLRNKTQEIFTELKSMFSQKIADAKTKVEAITTYYTLNELAGGWGVGASWTDSKGKTHSINSGNDLEYKIPAGKSLYVFNYKSSGYRSRRLVALTDKIHNETLTGKGYTYYSAKKNGKIAFFVCDVKSEETAKKIVTKYCNQNDCFGYMMLDTKDHTKSNEGFDKLIEDVGQNNLLKVSDYKHLSQSNTPRKKSTRSSQGSVSDQDVFFIYGASKDSGNITNQYNDAQFLKTLTQTELDDFSDSEDIVYIPITRYKSNDNENLPMISELHYMINDASMKNLIKDMFGNTKIYAIKSSLVKKMSDDGYNMIPFNDFFMDSLKKIKSRFDSVISYNDLVEYCRKQYQDNDANTNRFYNYGTVLHQFAYHMLNIFGLDYAKFIKNQDMVDAINYHLITEFFADTIHRLKYDITKFTKEEYFYHMNSILQTIGIDQIDSEKIRTTNVEYHSLLNMIKDRVYKFDSDKYVNIIQSQTKTKYQLPKASEVRKTIKEAIDKNPMIKYIMGTNQVTGMIRELKDKNPISSLDSHNSHNSYYTHSKDWFAQMDNDSVDLFKIQLSSLIK